jgi:hypothetical protein
MRLAEKWDDMTDEDAPVGQVLEVSADGSQASPAAALTAGLIQRGKNGCLGAGAEASAQQPGPEEPIGARAQQAVLEEVFAEPEPVTATPAIDHAEFQSVREAAAEWHLFRAPSASFWDRFLKDVSIFTIFFAVLVFVILQIM